MPKPGTTYLGVGEGGANAGVPLVLSGQGGAVATAANTTETTLFTYTLPKRSLAIGKSVRIRATFSTAANANTKRLRLYFGATVVADTAAVGFNNLTGVLEALVTVLTATTQTAVGGANVGTTIIAPAAAGPAEAINTADIIIKVTGLNGTAAASDIVGRQLTIELLPEGGP